MSAPSPSDPAALLARVQASFVRQGMMLHLGARLLRVESGLCELALPYSDKVTQQQGGFHGGAIGALADIAGGYAALTVCPEGTEVTTVEYKINFMNAFQGGELRAKRLGLSLTEAKEIIDTYESPRDTAPQLRKFLVVLEGHKRQIEEQMADLQANLEEIKAHERESRALLAKAESRSDKRKAG